MLTISFIHRRRGDVSLLLMSPSGTKNEMLSTRHYDDSKEGLDNWGFMTVHCWGKCLLVFQPVFEPQGAEETSVMMDRGFLKII